MRTIVLTLHHPWQRSHGGSQRTRALVKALVSLGHEVTCVHPGPPGPAPDGVADVGTGQVPLGQQSWSSPLRAVKRRYVPMPTAAGARDRSIATALAGLAPADLLVVGELGGARYCTTADAATLWVDFPDLLSAAAALDAARRSGLSRSGARAQSRVLDQRERRVALGADIVTAAGWGDTDLLGSRVQRSVVWLPTSVEQHPWGVGAEGLPRTAGFFGNFAHLPNRDGYDILRRSWAPSLREHGWDVLVAGHDSDRLPPSPHLEIIGPVQSPAEFYARVGLTLAPLRMGGGMKVKVVESLAFGRPVVVAPAVLIGFPSELHRHLAVADLHHPDFTVLPTKVGPEAAELLERFSPDRFVETVASVLERLPRGACA